MKPRKLAQTMIEEMRKTAERVWKEHGESLEVEDKQKGKEWVWSYIKDHFGRG